MEEGAGWGGLLTMQGGRETPRFAQSLQKDELVMGLACGAGGQAQSPRQG